VQPTGDSDAVDNNLVTRLQLRVKELEWECSVLQNEIDSKQTNGTDEQQPEQPQKEVSDAIKVRTCCYGDKSKVWLCFSRVFAVVMFILCCCNNIQIKLREISHFVTLFAVHRMQMLISLFSCHFIACKTVSGNLCT